MNHAFIPINSEWKFGQIVVVKTKASKVLLAGYFADVFPNLCQSVFEHGDFGREVVVQSECLKNCKDNRCIIPFFLQSLPCIHSRKWILN
jgi:hypothetical protein